MYRRQHLIVVIDIPQLAFSASGMPICFNASAVHFTSFYQLESPIILSKFQ